jgi:hypothetical protein
MVAVRLVSECLVDGCRPISFRVPLYLCLVDGCCPFSAFCLLLCSWSCALTQSRHPCRDILVSRLNSTLYFPQVILPAANRHRRRNSFPPPPPPLPPSGAAATSPPGLDSGVPCAEHRRAVHGGAEPARKARIWLKLTLCLLTGVQKAEKGSSNFTCLFANHDKKLLPKNYIRGYKTAKKPTLLALIWNAPSRFPELANGHDCCKSNDIVKT